MQYVTLTSTVTMLKMKEIVQMMGASIAWKENHYLLKVIRYVIMLFYGLSNKYWTGAEGEQFILSYIGVDETKKHQLDKKKINWQVKT